MTTRNDLIKKLIKDSSSEIDYDELMEILIDEKIAIDPDKEEQLSLGDKLADKLTNIAGSWGFIIGFTLFLIFWIILNGVLLVKAVDPYPFILLNLLLSCLAALQAPIIMMSQNRQAKKDSLRSRNDYRTDLKSELILEYLHDNQEEIIRNQKKLIKLLETEKYKKTKSNIKKNK